MRLHDFFAIGVRRELSYHEVKVIYIMQVSYYKVKANLIYSKGLRYRNYPLFFSLFVLVMGNLQLTISPTFFQ